MKKKVANLVMRLRWPLRGFFQKRKNAYTKYVCKAEASKMASGMHQGMDFFIKEKKVNMRTIMIKKRNIYLFCC
jgi:hypothetical protein